jgi:hypothetical protein
VWRGEGESWGAASLVGGEGSLLGWHHQARVGHQASLEAAWSWLTRQDTNSLSSAPIGNSAHVTWSCSLAHGLSDRDIEKRPPECAKQQDLRAGVLSLTSLSQMGSPNCFSLGSI